MATIGEQLLQPESGWIRYDDTDKNISYIGNEWKTDYDSHYSNTVGDKICFNFVGSKIRILVFTNNSHSKDVKIKINNIVYSYVEYIYPITPASLVLVFEKEMPSFKEYSAEIYIERKTDNQYGWFGLDSIDIDENGKLKPYNPNLSSIITWSPNDKTTNYTLSNNNLTASLSKTPPYEYHGIKATKFITNGKFYAEFLVNDMPNVCTLGLATYEASLSGYTSISQFPSNIKTSVINATENTFIGMAFDLDNHVINFYINGVLDINSTIILEKKVYTVIMINNNGENKGGTITANFGATPFNIVNSNEITWNKLVDVGYKPYDIYNANWEWRVSKYFLKQNNNYYSINNNYIDLGKINNDEELNNLIDEYGYNDLSILTKELNTKKVPTKLENDYYKSFDINLNDIKDSISLIEENDKKYIEYGCGNYKISDEIKKFNNGKFEVLMKE
ncbi:cell adhesion protein [Clostridium botulinum]|nr:cell adhesion protein [Clostridium botulinum]